MPWSIPLPLRCRGSWLGRPVQSPTCTRGLPHGSARLGGHVEQCDKCAHRTVAYNSCRNRHCPKCQALARARWFEGRSRDLLPVGYFHIVFTMPAELAPLALQNKQVVYDILFHAASETLLQIAADPNHLGATIGVLAVLHTCKVLSRVFRGKFLDYLDQAHRDGKLSLTASLEHLSDPDCFRALLHDVRRKPWVVYSKAPMAGPEQVLKYLARYTHRVAIANSRLVELREGRSRFVTKTTPKTGANA